MKTLGIIGGLGPETTAMFYLKIIDLVKEESPETRPNILISNVPIPIQIEEDLILRNTGLEKYLPFLIREAKRLQEAGADFLVIPCNSVHVLFDEIQSQVGIPILHIVDETIKSLKGCKIVGIIATGTTMNNNLYTRKLVSNQIETIKPDESEQIRINMVVNNLVKGTKSSEDEVFLREVCSNLRRRGAERVILACTDLQLLIDPNDKYSVDSMDALAVATAENICK